MKLIAAVDKNWGIGKDGRLLVSIPEDMKYFRGQTMGKVVVCGRRTLESFPGGRPLKDRTNIVLTKRAGYQAGDAITAHSLDELLSLLSDYDSDDIYIIGGETVYRQLAGYCDTAYITKIDYAYDADAHFPDLDADPEWRLAGESDEETYFDLAYTFCTYKKQGRQ